MSGKKGLDNSMMNRLLELQVMIKEDYMSDITYEELLIFLEEMINLFKIGILEKLNLSYVEKLKIFLTQYDNDDILRLYGLMQNDIEESFVKVK